jgi:hypothetical protein
LSTNRFYHPQTIEARANELLLKWQARGQPLIPPVPVERLAEDLLDLRILWYVVPEPANETILAGLAPRDKMIIFNEHRLALIDKTPGLYRTVLAHEIGHWELHVDKALVNQAGMPGTGAQLQFLFRSEKQSWDERNAHLFLSHLLVPQDLLAPLIRGVQLFDWPFLYRLRDIFDVTITVMKIRLERMGLLYVDENGKIHRSRVEYEGQLRMI